MKTTYRVNWDNGNGACGTFPNKFESEADAQAFADNWMNDRNLEDLGLTLQDVEERGGEGCYTAEVIEIEEPDGPDEEELIKREPWE